LNGLFSEIKFSTALLGSPFAGTLSLPYWDMPSLHNLVQRMPPVAPTGAKPEVARFTINWLSAAGTGVFVAALLTRCWSSAKSWGSDF
jgi:lactate permease